MAFVSCMPGEYARVLSSAEGRSFVTRAGVGGEGGGGGGGGGWELKEEEEEEEEEESLGSGEAAA